jgi:uncharacterized membrane protein YGL010W
MSTARLNRQFDQYSAFHRTRGNHLCHHFGIPLIMTSLLGLLSHWKITIHGLPDVDGGVVLWLGATLWYTWLDWRLAIPFSVFSLGGYLLGRSLSPWVLWSLFVLGWILQIIGHAVYEKKSPALLTNFKHFFIGPLWVFARWIQYPESSKILNPNQITTD